MRRAARIDANQSGIVEVLRGMGCGVQSLAPVGGGVPDLLVGISGDNYLAEIKDGSKPPSARKLTPDQERWHKAWPGAIEVIETEQQAIEWVNGLRRAGL